MPTSPEPFSTPNGQSLSTETNPITQSPSSFITAGSSVNGTNGPDVLSSVCKDDVYSPALQIYDDGLTSQAPVTISPIQAIVPAVTQSSPSQNCPTVVALFQKQSSRKRPASSYNPVNIEKKHKSWKGTHNSKTSMMLWLRNLLTFFSQSEKMMTHIAYVQSFWLTSPHLH